MLFDEYINEIKSIYIGMEPEKTKKIDKKLFELIEYVKSISALDLELNEHLSTYKGNSEVIPSSEFQEKMDNIKDDALTIYVSKAQLYKVYPHEKLEDFQNDDNTVYKKPEYGPVHEVVMDMRPQKFTVVVANDLDATKITFLKECIVTFIKKNPAYQNFTTNGISVFKYDDKTEFIVVSVVLKNSAEKELMIENFIKFLKKMGEKELHSKIEIKHPACEELEGARFYKLPSGKQSLNPNTLNLLDQLISISKPIATQNIIINNPTIIIQNNSNNTTSTVNIGTNSDKSFKAFYKFLYETKPSWYKENTLVEFSVIAAAYAKYSGLNKDGKTLSRQLNGYLFTADSGNKRSSKKKLVSFTKLKTYI